jgi:NADH:ubiquinone oxidoreductase subunit C
MSTTKHQELNAALAALAETRESGPWTTDAYGNDFCWYHLSAPRSLFKAAGHLAAEGARLTMITAYNTKQPVDPLQDVAYHFEVGLGTLYTLTVTLDQERPAVDSITSLFPNADWHEREMRELYGVQVDGHPNPRRLFLDDSFEAGLLGEAVPLSIMMNGACTTDLWERILKDRTQAEQQSARHEEAGS